MVNATGNHVPLILCCAEDGEVALVGVLDELHRMGHSPEVLTGVDSDPAVLTSAVDRVRGAALFILCESHELDRTQSMRLEGLFSARRGPEHDLLTVQLQPRNELAILPRIEAAVEKMSGNPTRASGEGGHHMRDVIGPTGAAAMRREVAEKAAQEQAAERIARELHEEMVAAEAVMIRRKAAREADRRPAASTRPASQPRAAAPSARAPQRAAPAPTLGGHYDDLVHNQTEPLDPRGHGETPPAAKRVPIRGVEPGARLLPDRGPRHEAPSDESRAGVPAMVREPVRAPLEQPLRESEPEPVRSAERAPSIRESAREASASAHDARREADEPAAAESSAAGSVAAGSAAASSAAGARDRAIANEVLERTDEFASKLPTDPSQLAARPPSTRPGSKLRFLLSGAGLLLLVVAAIMSMGEGEVTAPRGAAGVRSPSGAAKPSGEAIKPSADSGAKADGAAVAADGTAADGAAADGAAADGAAADGAAAGDPTPVPSADSGADTSPAAADSGTPSGADGGAGPVTPPAPPSTDLPPAVAQAVADGKIKRSGKTLVVAAPRETMTWDEADRRCRQRKVAGLGGWRLPTRGQLSQLRRAGLATTGSFWTRQVVGVDEVYAFDAKSARSSLWLKIEPNARSLCVRKAP